MRIGVVVILLIGLVVFLRGGMESKPPQGGLERPRVKEAPEFDCRKSIDKICKVPYKDKVVLYCYKGTIPKVVRYKEECK